jgi:fibronectin type 3 domain-containing protein
LDNALPGTFYNYYIVPIDFADNESPFTSDTAKLVTLGNKKIEPIQNLEARDTLNTVVLNWKPLPLQGYYSGIMILKSRKPTEDFVVIDTVASSASSYTDRNVIPGGHYYYQVRAIMSPLSDIKQLPSAMINITVSNKRKKPFAPQGLRAENEGKNIRLRWEMNPELDLFAYYVLRGTNPKNMQVVANKVQDITWVDTSVMLSGQTTYVYALQVMNQQQTLSDTSAPVFIQPVRSSMQLPNIGGLTGNIFGNRVQLRWEDVAARNYSVTGYIVLKKEKGSDKFMVANTTLLRAASYTDTLTDNKGTVYEYAIACMDESGNISNLSNSIFASVAVQKPMPPTKIYISQTQANVNLSWAPVSLNNNAAVSYIVYRKMEGQAAFTKLTTTAISKPEYTDATAQSGKLYSYAISTVAAGVEGNKSDVENWRRR